MRIGSLFSGYGGLDMAVTAFTGGRLEWVSDIDPASCRILDAQYPGVPNLGDVTQVDWATVSPVDVLTGGYPCQPFSHAGHRKGSDDERHLWPYVRDALAALRPMVGIFENVDGHRSLGLADVLGDIADLGMSARWGVVRASDAGAPHARKRVFIVVTQPNQPGLQGADARVDVGAGWSDAGGHAAASDYGSAADSFSRPLMRPAAAGNGLLVAAEHGDGFDWGKYAAAIHRWERILNRPAPSPTITGRDGRSRLSPVFVEWMMGLPEGHVTGHGLSNAQALRALGNGVVPQQALLALIALMDRPPLTDLGGPV